MDEDASRSLQGLKERTSSLSLFYEDRCIYSFNPHILGKFPRSGVITVKEDRGFNIRLAVTWHMQPDRLYFSTTFQNIGLIRKLLECCEGTYCEFDSAIEEVVLGIFREAGLGELF